MCVPYHPVEVVHHQHDEREGARVQKHSSQTRFLLHTQQHELTHARNMSFLLTEGEVCVCERERERETERERHTHTERERERERWGLG